MSDLIYRDLRWEDEKEVQWAALNYSENPSYWEKDWPTADPATLNKFVTRIRSAQGDDQQKLLVAETRQFEKAAFHWIKIEPAPAPGAIYSNGIRISTDETSYAQIMHLWVSQDFWNQRIARTIKKLGEEWALSRGVKRIQTSVHYSNRRMLELNFRLGFEAGNIILSKTLER